ncbi:tyrosine-type recombinase/integrase [Eubacteriaceae bacterium ES3]|nr:tyrosine-type recombinase/integrase [Eubacteriaceae bacterium ES3]WKY49015.1 tyrosine-type recombinase/integrase [Eubacteriaceae bacterium ES3]
MMKSKDFQSLLQRYFVERLINQQRVSPCTIESYRDTFRIFLKYMHDVQHIKSDKIQMEDLNADTVVEFLNYLEKVRKNQGKTINNRLAAIKAFMDYVSYQFPESLELVRRIKAIPFRNIDKKDISYLTKDEIDCLLNACNIKNSEGKRDYLMVLLLYNSGIRVSEMITIQGKDIIISDNDRSHLRIMGKGRKERIVPLWQSTTKYLIEYLQFNKISDHDYLLSGRNVNHLTRSGVRYRIDCIVKVASEKNSKLKTKNITPHVFRHSTAMSLLQAGVDLSTIAIWLGHESIETTHKYMVADITLKEKALDKLNEPNVNQSNNRYHATDDILQFLNSL